MNTMDNDKLLRQYLDGDLSPEEEQEALHIIADNPELRSMLRFEQLLSESLSDGPVFQKRQDIPDGFTDRVMHQIEQQEEHATVENIFEKLHARYRQLWVPQQVQWRPVYGFVLGFLVLISLSYPVILSQNKITSESLNANIQNPENSVQQVSAQADEVMLRFIYIDEEASSIAVAGDFNNWEPVELSKENLNGKTVWTGLVSMNRGEHNYMFVKDGKKWVTDPLAPIQRDDGFGNKNAVIYI